jgi:hypothetical protein
MTASLPKLHVPVTVDTTGVDKGLTALERKMRNAAAKAKRLGMAAGGGGAGAAGGPIKASQASAFLGSVGKLGPATGLLGGFGAAGAAAAAPFAIAGLARAQVEQMAALTKGATDALQEFRMTGQQTFASNSAILERLAALESDAQKRAKVMGYGDAFSFGAGREGGESLLDKLSLFASQASGYLGAVMGGKSQREALLTAQLVGASEQEAFGINAQLRAEERAQAAGPQMGVGLPAELALNALLESTFFKLDKIIQQLGRQ